MKRTEHKGHVVSSHFSPNTRFKARLQDMLNCVLLLFSISTAHVWYCRCQVFLMVVRLPISPVGTIQPWKHSIIRQEGERVNSIVKCCPRLIMIFSECGQSHRNGLSKLEWFLIKLETDQGCWGNKRWLYFFKCLLFQQG